ncbi:rhodanese-like domain-containing protein [Paenibacillus hexagrammi]|uniref:Rhodanese-like domain-containing protein n=1 Tax=Paenibacillus hexagrammi TaxID=2908839 RepID=A0ABY3SB05_9BACL|nr:rhodanese-like domain-containing protein [Paenibacillus sp. YPD9-1]UJF31173.1 rhodanese-like domain-containing protein [Paenibacillus sp. YPD9-1]
MEIKSIHPATLVNMLDENKLDGSIIIDVRERHEWEYYHLDEALLIPMREVPHRLGEIDGDQNVYIVCAHGVRSYMVCEFLAEQGYEHVVNVEGGMAAIGSIRGFQYD